MLKNQRHSAILLLPSPGAAQGEALFTNWFCAKEEVSRALETCRNQSLLKYRKSLLPIRLHRCTGWYAPTVFVCQIISLTDFYS